MGGGSEGAQRLDGDAFVADLLEFPAERLEGLGIGDLDFAGAARVNAFQLLGAEDGPDADPAGNVANGLLEVVVLLGGEPPVIASLPQLLVAAGGEEQALSLDLYVEDADSPTAQLTWQVSAEPGVAARILERRLLVSVPAGESGACHLVLAVTDPEGNRDEAEMTVLIESDDQPPSFAVEVSRNAAASHVLEVLVRPDEPLAAAPTVDLSGAATAVTPTGDGSYLASYAVPPVPGTQSLSVAVRGADLAGNEGEREVVMALRWMADAGGTLASTDGLAAVNVPAAAAGSGHLASLRRLDEAEAPADADGQPVYAVGLSPSGELLHPVSLNLFAGSQVAADTGILRWDPEAQAWEELPTTVDEDTGWLSTPVDGDGLYRLGPVASTSRRNAEKLANHPNPFPTATAAATTIEYTLAVPGPVYLQVLNSLGQRVRLLVDEAGQGVGTWTVAWDGRDDAGHRLGSGVYFYQLREGGAVRTRSLLLLR